MTANRIAKIRDFLRNKQGDGFLVSHPKNIFYLSGFHGVSETERESSLLITKTQSYLFIPAMYEHQAKNAQKQHSTDLEIVVDKERDGLLFLFGNFLSRHAKVYYESADLRVQELERIKEKTTCIPLPSSDCLESLRVIKDTEEIANIRKAVEIAEKTFQDLLDFIKNNDITRFSEQDLADVMRRISLGYGSEGFGFDPIIATGAGSAIPHYFTGGSKIQRESPLLLDFGMKYAGYTSDITRTLFLGKPHQRFLEVYEWVRECQEQCIAACKPGISTKTVAELSVSYFQKRNKEEYFLHGLGHGLGLAVHESPYLRPTQDTILQPGMVVTIEPGLYFEQEFGVRIEDDILITEKGCEVFTQNTDRSLISI